VSFAQDTLRFEDSILAYLAETELRSIQSLILDVKDCAYFGHYNMEFVTRMQCLKNLELWADQGENYSWNTSFSNAERPSWPAYVSRLLGAFEDAKEINPGWECPDVRIFNRGTGLNVENIKGGALIPGWVEE